jgi:hypothetical protein
MWPCPQLLTIFWLFSSSSQCVSQHVPNNTSLYPIHYPQCYPLRTCIIGRIFGLVCVYVWNKYIFILASLQSFKPFFFVCDGLTEETHCKKRILNLDGTDLINYYRSLQHSINKGFFFKVVKNALYLLSTQELWMHWYEHIWCGINLDD